MLAEIVGESFRAIMVSLKIRPFGCTLIEKKQINNFIALICTKAYI